MRWIVAFILLLAAVPAQAASVLALSVAELTAKSDAVVVARVEGVGFELDDGGNIATRNRIRIEEAWKGEVAGDVDVLQAGGRLGDKVARIAGDYALATGDRVVLFLRRVEGTWYGTLLGWGAFRVGNGPDPQVSRLGDGLNLLVRLPSGALVAASKSDLAAPGTLAALRSAVRGGR